MSESPNAVMFEDDESEAPPKTTYPLWEIEAIDGGGIVLKNAYAMSKKQLDAYERAEIKHFEHPTVSKHRPFSPEYRAAKDALIQRSVAWSTKLSGIEKKKWHKLEDKLRQEKLKHWGAICDEQLATFDKKPLQAAERAWRIMQREYDAKAGVSLGA